MVWQLQFPILFWIVVVFVVLTALLWVAHALFDEGWDDGFLVAGVIFSVITGFLIVALVIVAIPFNSKYWFITHPQGTITSDTYHGGVVIDGDSGTVYVVQLNDQDRQYVVDDDKVTSYKVGDHVTLACTVQWNYSAADTYNCSIAGK